MIDLKEIKIILSKNPNNIKQITNDMYLDACSNGNLELITYLCENNYIDPKIKIDEAIHKLVSNGKNFKAISYLLNNVNPENIKEQLTLKLFNQNKEDELSFFKSLLFIEKQKNITKISDINLINQAIFLGNIAIVKHILKEHKKHITDMRVLRNAVKTNSEHIINCFLENGLVLNQNEHSHLLEIAANSKSLKVMNVLIKNGINPDDKNMNGLFNSIRNGEIEIIKAYIENGADIGFDNNKALLLACAYGRLEIIKYLISNNASLEKIGDDALTAAIKDGQDHVVKYLLCDCNQNVDVFLENEESNQDFYKDLKNWALKYKNSKKMKDFLENNLNNSNNKIIKGKI